MWRLCQVKLQLWDTAGQEEFSKLTRNYYKGAKACVIAFSTTDRDSFDAVRKWIDQAKATIQEDIAWVLVQNKCDLLLDPKAEITSDEADELAKAVNLKLYRMSVKDNMMVDDVFKYLGQTAYEIMQRPPQAAAAAPAAPVSTSVEVASSGSAAAAPAKADTVSLTGPSKQRTDGKKSGCC